VEKAIELNGVAVKSNLHTLKWGRMAAQEPEAVARFLAEAEEGSATELPMSETLEQLVERRVNHLTAYQNAAYADEYKAFVDKVRNAEQQLDGVGTSLSEGVAFYLSKLMSYKDEYEVARLYTNGDFERRLKKQFDGDYKLKFHLAPPIISPTNKRTGKPGKIEFGGWMWQGFKVLAKFKGLRGTALDIFGYSQERKRERSLIREYRATVDSMLQKLDKNNYAAMVEIAELPELIKGYGHIKEDNIGVYEQELAKKLDELEKGKDQLFVKVA